MEYVLKAISIIVLCLLSTFYGFSKNLNEFVLVIDPGHGGHDSGAPGAKSKEKNVVLDVALLFGDLVKANCPDVKIIYTRKTDKFIDLWERAAIANQAKADLFISIHANANKSKTPYGAETYILGLARTDDNLEVAKRENSVILLEDNYKTKYENFDPNSSESYIIFEFLQNKYVEQSILLASNIQKELKNTAKQLDRGVRQAGFLVIRETSMPSVLVELGFISNRKDEIYMNSQEGQKNFANSLYKAFSQYKTDHDRKMGVYTVKPVKNEERNKPQEQVVSTVVEDQDVVDIETNNKVKQEVIPEKKESGEIFKIQILTSPSKLSANSKQLKGYKTDFYKDKSLYKYVYGNFTNINDANKARRKVSKDFKDAFVISFKNGIRVK